MKQYKACEKREYSQTKCRFVAQIQLAVNYFRGNSSKKARLAEELRIPK